MLVYFYTILSLIVLYIFCQQQIHAYSRALYTEREPQVIYKRRCGWLYFAILLTFVFAIAWSDELIRSLIHLFEISTANATETSPKPISVDSILSIPPEQRSILIALLLLLVKEHQLFQRLEKPFLNYITDGLGGKEEFDELQKRIIDSYQYNRADRFASKAIQDNVNSLLKDYKYIPSSVLEKKIRGFIVHLLVTKHHRTFNKDDKISEFVKEACLLFSKKKEHDSNKNKARAKIESPKLTKVEQRSALQETDNEFRLKKEALESELSMLVWDSLVFTLKKMSTSVSNMSELTKQLNAINIRLPRQDIIGSGFGWKAFAFSIPLVLVSCGLYVSFFSPFTKGENFTRIAFEQFVAWSMYWLISILIGICMGFIAARFHSKVRENTEESFYKKSIIFSCLTVIVYFVCKNILKTIPIQFPDPIFASYVLYPWIFFGISFTFLSSGASEYTSRKYLNVFNKLKVEKRTITNLILLSLITITTLFLFLLTLKTHHQLQPSLSFFAFLLIISLGVGQIIYHCAYRSAKRHLHTIERYHERLRIAGIRLEVKVKLQNNEIYEGRLIDFSDEGCCVILDDELDDEIPVTLEIRDVELQAKSIWHSKKGTFHKRFKSGFNHTDDHSATLFMERLRDLGYDNLIVNP